MNETWVAMEMRTLTCSFKDPDKVKISSPKFLGKRTMRKLFIGITTFCFSNVEDFFLYLYPTSTLK